MRRSVIAAGTVLALLALAGCSSSAGGARRSAVSDSGGATSVLRAPQGTPATGTQQRVSIGPARIITAELTLRAKSGADVAKIANAATDMVTTAGGNQTGDRRTEAGSGTQADLVFKVPPEKYPAILDRIAKLGKELSRSAQAEDVTDQVVDVDSRVRSQEASVARIRTLLTGAHTIGDVVQIEGELAKREADLESLKARQRALDGQTSLATITLHVRGPKAAVVSPAKKPRGFVVGLSHGWAAFTAATTWLLTAIGALLPFLITAGLALAAATAVRRRRQSRHPSPSADPAPASAAAS
ncbi:MAG: DUF4349 domain-containing protein [Pseudonocardiales bacterium]|nr:MAG: DUF4349 domain-containing protein [Pseudonocardiales bacterium]